MRRVRTKLTDFISAILFIVERVHDPILRVNYGHRSLAATMVHRRNDITANDIDHINIQDICDNENRKKKKLCK